MLVPSQATFSVWPKMAVRIPLCEGHRYIENREICTKNEFHSECVQLAYTKKDYEHSQLNYLFSDIIMVSAKVKVIVTMTLKSWENQENSPFFNIFIIFTKTICPKATKYGMSLVYNKGFYNKTHSMTSTLSEGHNDLEKRSKLPSFVKFCQKLNFLKTYGTFFHQNKFIIKPI